MKLKTKISNIIFALVGVPSSPGHRNSINEAKDKIEHLMKSEYISKEKVKELLGSSWDNKRTRYENILEGLEDLLNDSEESK